MARRQDIRDRLIDIERETVRFRRRLDEWVERLGTHEAPTGHPASWYRRERFDLLDAARLLTARVDAHAMHVPPVARRPLRHLRELIDTVAPGRGDTVVELVPGRTPRRLKLILQALERLRSRLERPRSNARRAAPHAARLSPSRTRPEGPPPPPSPHERPHDGAPTRNADADSVPAGPAGPAPMAPVAASSAPGPSRQVDAAPDGTAAPDAALIVLHLSNADERAAMVRINGCPPEPLDERQTRFLRHLIAADGAHVGSAAIRANDRERVPQIRKSLPDSLQPYIESRAGRNGGYRITATAEVVG